MIFSFIICGYFKYLICIFLILFFHDLGHIIFLKVLGYKIDKIEILPFGANINTNMILNSKSRDIFLVSIAGILFQLILYLLFYIIFKLGFISFIFYNIFLKYNTILILFNLLPVYPLDGNKVLFSLIECVFSYKKALFYSNIISILMVIILFYLNYVFKLDNYPIIIFILCKLLIYIKEYKYVFNKFLCERQYFDLKYRKVKNINKVSNIYKNKLNFINGVNEKKILFKNK